MSGGLRTSVKGHLLAQRLTLASDPLLENESTNNNVTAPLDVPLHAVEEITMDSTTYGLGICDGNIPCFPMLNAAKNMVSDRTRTGADCLPPQGVNLNREIPSVSEPSSSQTEGEILHSFNLKSFHIDELKAATGNWCNNNCVGKGGFGHVFKGWIDKRSFKPAKPGTGLAIAIRRLTESPGALLQSPGAWTKKFNSLGQLHHPNLAKLIGYCINRSRTDNARFLVYEFVPKGSLEHHLFRSSFGIHNFSGRGGFQFQMLSWNLRMKIALGAAKGLAFLHSDQANVIFVDLQTSKVLLDSNYNVKLCGYAPAKERLGRYRKQVYQLIYVDELCESEDFERRDAYTAPEYQHFREGSLTSKSDVYSFGILLLEILSGRRACDKYNLWELYDHSDLLILALSRCEVGRIIDARLKGKFSQSGAVKALDLATECLSKEPKLRPDMNQVIEILEELQSTSE